MQFSSVSVSSFLLDLNILLNTLFSITLNLYYICKTPLIFKLSQNSKREVRVHGRRLNLIKFSVVAEKVNDNGSNSKDGALIVKFRTSSEV